MSPPRVLVAGLRGGDGKTLVALGLAAAFRRRGLRVAPFKKGPDYIDAAWLSLAAGAPCRNLDLFLMGAAAIRSSFGAASGAGLAVIEGNRGLFDGMDAAGSCSSAELARRLRAPVLLVIDCTKASRTPAAAVLGCRRLDPAVRIAGVILNRVGGGRHEAVAREAVEKYGGVPVVGAIPRLAGPLFPERHLGLVPPQESKGAARAVEAAGKIAERHLDLGAVLRIARAAPRVEVSPAKSSVGTPSRVRIGVFRDAAFQFYYPENLEALEREGARLVEISPIRQAELPDVDALYLGGGFPETLAPRLAANGRFRRSLRRRIERGLPVYAECGGAVYLGEQLRVGGRRYPMTGALPVAFRMGERPQGHGYAVLETTGKNPFFPVGESWRGHEFHYTRLERLPGKGLSFAFRVRRGFGFDGRRDGLCRFNVLACYTHLHALGAPGWAARVVRRAALFRGVSASPT